MNTLDFPTEHGTKKISRLDAAKSTFTQFVEGRSDDLIGLVVFANYPELACPPILDHQFLLDTVANVRVARFEDDGTNMGDAIAVGLDALLVAPPKKKVLVQMGCDELQGFLFAKPMSARALMLWAINDRSEGATTFKPSLFDETRHGVSVEEARRA